MGKVERGALVSGGYYNIGYRIGIVGSVFALTDVETVRSSYSNNSPHPLAKRSLLSLTLPSRTTARTEDRSTQYIHTREISHPTNKQQDQPPTQGGDGRRPLGLNT